MAVPLSLSSEAEPSFRPVYKNWSEIHDPSNWSHLCQGGSGGGGDYLVEWQSKKEWAEQKVHFSILKDFNNLKLTFKSRRIL